MTIFKKHILSESDNVDELKHVELLLSNLQFIAESNYKLASERSKMEWTAFASLITFFIVITGAAFKSENIFCQYKGCIPDFFWVIGILSSFLLILIARAHQKTYDKAQSATDQIMQTLKLYNLLSEKNLSKLELNENKRERLIKFQSCRNWIRRWSHCILQIAILAIVIFFSIKIITYDKPQSEPPQINQTTWY